MLIHSKGCFSFLQNFMGIDKIVFSYGAYAYRKERIEDGQKQDSDEEHSDDGKEYDQDTESPVHLSDEQEENLFLGVQDVLGYDKVLDLRTIAKFRKHIPSIFRKFLKNKIAIPNQRMLKVAIHCMCNMEDLDQFIAQVVQFQILILEEDCVANDYADFKAYIIHHYFIFELQEIERERKVNQQRIYLLLKDKAEKEMSSKMPDCGCGEKLFDIDYVEHKKSKRHVDKLFKVCQFLFETSDVIDVLSMTRLNTVDRSVIDAIISFLVTNPLNP